MLITTHFRTVPTSLALLGGGIDDLRAEVKANVAKRSAPAASEGDPKALIQDSVAARAQADEARTGIQASVKARAAEEASSSADVTAPLLEEVKANVNKRASAADPEVKTDEAPPAEVKEAPKLDEAALLAEIQGKVKERAATAPDTGSDDGKEDAAPPPE